MQVLVEGNFIERCGINMYRWTHDKVQEVALSLGSASEASFQFQIGTVLCRALSEAELEHSLFDVVNLINKAKVKRRAEYAELNITTVVPKPENLTHEEAGSIPLVGLTAVNGLIHCANLQAGQRVLVIGASGGVGTLAVQIAKNLGRGITVPEGIVPDSFQK